MMKAATTLQARLKNLVDELVNQGVSLDQARREFEKQFIITCISANEGNLSRSAKCLGIHRNTLRNKVEGLGIELGDSKPAARRPARRASSQRGPQGQRVAGESA
jgi:DNA-binding NtrC family response regulator